MTLKGVIMKCLLLIYVLLGVSVTSPAASQVDYKNVSLCDALSVSRKPVLKYVAIDAEFFIARPHGAVLIDKRCPDKVMAVDFPAQGADESVSNLARSMRNGEWPIESTGLFRGRIMYGAKHKRPVFSLRSVLNLQPKNEPTAPPEVTTPTKQDNLPVPRSSYVAPTTHP
jgi:hypothetical protein